MTEKNERQSADAVIRPEDAVESLLPWYVAGTATEGQRRQVEGALAADPSLRDQLELIAEEMHAARIVNEEAGHAPANALVRLMEEIERTVPRQASARNSQTSARLSPVARWLEWLGRPAILAPLALAGILLVLGQAAVIASLLGRPAGAIYSTASGGTLAAAGTQALIAFAPGAPAAEIDALLEQQNMRIVDGPLPGGLYHVLLSRQTLSTVARDALLAKLRAESKLVRLVQPTD